MVLAIVSISMGSEHQNTHANSIHTSQIGCYFFYAPLTHDYIHNKNNNNISFSLHIFALYWSRVGNVDFILYVEHTEKKIYINEFRALDTKSDDDVEFIHIFQLAS